MWQQLVAWARRVRDDTLAVYFCARHPRTPWVAKVLALLIAGYALSPVDLIPDFIPLLGYVDELILLPGAIYLCLRLVPTPVLAECREQAQRWLERNSGRPRSYAAAAVIVLLWIGLGWIVWHWIRASVR